MTLTERLKKQAGRMIPYYPAWARVLGGHGPAVLLAQIAYWTDKGSLPDGWIYKYLPELGAEIGMARRKLTNARNALKEKGLLEEANGRDLFPKKFGKMDKIVLFRINMERLDIYLSRMCEENDQVEQKNIVQSAEKTNKENNTTETENHTLCESTFRTYREVQNVPLESTRRTSRMNQTYSVGVAPLNYNTLDSVLQTVATPKTAEPPQGDRSHSSFREQVDEDFPEPEDYPPAENNTPASAEIKIPPPPEPITPPLTTLVLSPHISDCGKYQWFHRHEDFYQGTWVLIPPLADFNFFWAALPLWTRVNETRCRKIWNNLSEPARVLARDGAVRLYGAVAEAPEATRRFIPKPMTYLTDKRWSDTTESWTAYTVQTGAKQSMQDRRISPEFSRRKK